MNYIEIDFNEVKGYSKLSEGAKVLFRNIYKFHNTVVGTEYKKEWEPVEVEECEGYLRVVFRNGEWLHYLPNGTWY